MSFYERQKGINRSPLGMDYSYIQSMQNGINLNKWCKMIKIIYLKRIFIHKHKLRSLFGNRIRIDQFQQIINQRRINFYSSLIKQVYSMYPSKLESGIVDDLLDQNNQNQQRTFNKSINEDKQRNEHFSKLGFYNHNYLKAQIFLINSDSMLKEEIEPFFECLFDKKAVITFARNMKQCIRFLQAGSCYFGILADIENAEELLSVQQYSKYLCYIGEISIYLPNKKDGNDFLRYNKLKACFPHKVGKFYSSFGEYVEPLKPYMRFYRQFRLNSKNQIVMRNLKVSSNMHPSYFLVDEDITQLYNHKLQLLRVIKLFEHENSYRQNKNDKSLVQAMLQKFHEYLQVLNEGSQEFKRKRQTKLKNLRDAEVLEDKSEDDGQEIEDSQQFYKKLEKLKTIIAVHKSIQRQHGYLKKEDNVVRLLSLYKCDSIYHNVLNSLIRVGKRLSDFDIIAIPFAQKFHSISYLYHQRIRKNKWLREPIVVWRMVKLQDVEKLINSKEKYCEFSGFSSFSKDINKIFVFKDKRCPQGYVLVRLRIPAFQYDQNDKRLENDHGFIDFKKQIINPNRKSYANTMKKLDQVEQQNYNQKLGYPQNKAKVQSQSRQIDEKYLQDSEQELILNCLSISINLGKSEISINNVNHEFYDFVYTTPHEIKDKQRQLQQKINELQKNAETNQLSQTSSLQFDLKYVDKVLEHYNTFNQKFHDSKNVGDVLSLLGDYDKVKLYYESSLNINIQNSSEEDLCKYVAVSLECNNSLQLNLIKKLANVFTFVQNPSDQQLKLQNTTKDTLETQQDNLQLVSMLHKKLSFMKNLPNKWFQIAKIHYESGRGYMADSKWIDGEQQLQLSKHNLDNGQHNLKEIISQIQIKRQNLTQCTSCFWDLFSSKDQELQKQIQTLISSNRNLWNILDLLIQVHLHLIQCKKHILSEFDEDKDVNQLKNQLRIFISWKRLLNNDGKIPNDLRLYKSELNNSVQDDDPETKKRLLKEFKDELKRQLEKDPKSKVVGQLLQLMSSIQKSNIREGLNCVSQKYRIEVSEEQSKSIQKVQKIMKSDYLFNNQKLNRQINETTRNMEESIEIFCKVQGDTIEVLKKRSQFIQFLSETNQVAKSINQSFAIIKSSFGDKHSVGAQAYYNLARSYHFMGSQKQAFKALKIAIYILRKAKVKEQKQPYQNLFEVSQTRLKIEMVRAKIYMTQLNKDMHTKALESLITVEDIIKDNKCSISLTLLAEVAQEKGNYFALPIQSNNSSKNYGEQKSSTKQSQQKQLQPVVQTQSTPVKMNPAAKKQFQKALTRISNQNGKKSLKNALIYCSLAKHMLSNNNIEKAKQYHKRGLKILSGFPFNHPSMWSSLLVLSKITTLQNEDQAFQLSYHCKEIVEHRFPPQSMNHIRVTYNHIKSFENKLQSPHENYENLLQVLKVSCSQQSSINLKRFFKHNEQVLQSMEKQLQIIKDEKEALHQQILLKVIGQDKSKIKSSPSTQQSEILNIKGQSIKVNESQEGSMNYSKITNVIKTA